MRKQVLINVEATDMRVAMLEDGALVELFVENSADQSILANIYKGKVESVVPGLRAVFVDIGLDRNAFLHFADILKEYELPTHGRPERAAPIEAKHRDDRAEEAHAAVDEFIEPQDLPGDVLDPLEGKPKRPSRPRRPLHVGDSILVQVTKEPIGRKGARITSYVSLPGRYLVMMPFSERSGGVSRKIEDQTQRRRLRELLHRLGTEHGSLIIRTAGIEEEEAEIIDDHEALVKQWKSIKRKNLRHSAPSLIHNERETLTRLVRDTLRNEIDEILIDSRPEMKMLIKACESMAPRMVERVHIYEGRKNIFDVFEVEQQFQKALKHQVWLKSGGFLVIDETEALTAIDVNSGKYVGKGDQDQVIFKTNLEACAVISRQLRLRDLGGLIVMDFIDMTNRDHQQQVMRELKSCLRRDEAKYALTGFSDFGIVEMTRKRVRMSLANVVFRVCPYCQGAGRILNDAQIWKNVKYELIDKLSQGGPYESAQITVHSEVKTYLEREVLVDIKTLADRFAARLEFVDRPDYHHEQFLISKLVKSKAQPQKKARPRRVDKVSKKALESAARAQDNSG